MKSTNKRQPAAVWHPPRWLVVGALLVGISGATTMTRAADTNPVAPAQTLKALGAATDEPTIVTSDRLRVDYLNNTGTFEGNVLVVDPRISLRADKMVVTFAGTGTNDTQRSVQRIEAIGAVVITQADRKAESEQAVYTDADGRVVLTGNPRVQNEDGTVTGDRITFWRDEKRMDVESGTRLILYPEQWKKEAAEKEKAKGATKDATKEGAEGETGEAATEGAPAANP